MRSVDKRRDDRTIAVFSNNIEDYSRREMLWGLVLRKDFCERGQECDIEEHGVDNAGKLITTRLPNYNVDKIFVFQKGGRAHIEIKTCPDGLDKFFTFKVTSLMQCVNESAYILVPQSQAYYLVKPETSEYLLTFEHKIYPRFSPNDPAVRIYKNEIIDLVDFGGIVKKKWMPEASRLIAANCKELFREKAK